MTLPLTASIDSNADGDFNDVVEVLPIPHVSLGTDAGLCVGNAPVELKNTASVATGAYHYTWNTGDTTEHLRIKHPGLYSLTISSGSAGCSNTDSIEITKDCYLDIPNAFTPNGDGQNDHFFPRQSLAGSIASFKMQIFNRWGLLVFETYALNGRGWDGRLNNLDQPSDVYIYSIEIFVNNNHIEKYRGNVTLVR